MTAFFPDDYWRSMGEHLAGPGAATPEHVEAEARLAEVLRDLDGVKSVLDVGCGRGRLASVLLEVLPKARYSGMDIGPAQIDATKLVRPEGSFYESRLQDFKPKRKWDLVLCSEVLMHVPPADIGAVARMLLGATRKYLVMVEWVPEPWELDEPIAPENWPHDYGSLFGPFAHVERIYRQDLMLLRR